MQPEVVDGGRFALEAVGPFAAVFVLGVFPFGADAFLEEVVIGFEGEFGDGGDVVLWDVDFSKDFLNAEVVYGDVRNYLRRHPKIPPRSRR